ncbi:MAG: hypothetical protein NZO16_00030 [Deltaproteobacteria bacterium]|nr:hypothetical protein [Deltaproteobacteria bacterium]
MFDYCILDITNHVGEYWLVTGCFEIQTNFFARQNFKNFLFWNFISELLINCLEEQTAYEEIFDALNKFWKFPNTSNLLNVITSVSLSSGVTKCDESIENQIDQIELAFDFELKSKREFFEILRTEIIA